MDAPHAINRHHNTKDNCEGGSNKQVENSKAISNTYRWQGVAPGSEGQTQRIFDRAQDWHALGRYFWTSGVARESSPDTGVESGMFLGWELSSPLALLGKRTEMPNQTRVHKVSLVS